MARSRSPERRPSPRARGIRLRLALLLFTLSGFAAAVLAGCSEGADELGALRFARHGEPVATLGLVALQRLAPPRRVRVFEPYEAREVDFEALPLARVLDEVYGEDWRREEELLFTCRDGYQPTVPVQRVLDHSAWLAFERAGGAGFSIDKLESGRRKRIALAPFYLVWENLEDPVLRQEGDYGWPYQLIGVELIRARDRFPGMAPPRGAPAAEHAGFVAFRRYCSRCHPVNGQGGSIGPELAGAVSPLAARDSAWLRRWIDDPSQFVPDARMPALNPALPDRAATIDAIVSYLHALTARLREPLPSSASEP